jgi:uncharacterized protein YbjT (DUF2867 family)
VTASISDIRQLLKVKVLPKASDPRRVFITGGTGYLGSELIPVLLERGHRVRALIRPKSRGRVIGGCEVVSGDALDGNSYRKLIHPCDTFIHLVGVRHPAASNGEQFRKVDLVAAREAIQAAAVLGVSHFIYMSVAQPAPVMKAYVAVRSECEELIRQQNLNATILRPWYVLGPGHRWPLAVKPFYRLAELLPFTRTDAQRLAPVTLDQMILALVQAVESPAAGVRVVEAPAIRAARVSLDREATRRTA